MLERTLSICEAVCGRLYLHDEGLFTTVAWKGASASVYHEPFRPSPETGLASAAASKSIVHFEDVARTARYLRGDADTVRTVDLGGARTFLAIPLIASDNVIGVFTVFRNQVRPFSAQQVRLADSFAKSAALALVNARLFEAEQARTRELAEALDRQTATAEVLRVISSSPTGIEPVFNAILRRAVSFCGATFGVIYRFDGEQMHVMAHHNFTPDALSMLLSHYPSRPGPAKVSSRSLLERTVVQVEDASDPAAVSVTIARLLAYRGVISVPMLREGVAIGTITVAKRERGLFSKSPMHCSQSSRRL